MYKIKMFSQESYRESLEKQFNRWSEANPEVVVLDLKYQINNGTHYLCVGYDDCNFKDEGLPVEQ